MTESIKNGEYKIEVSLSGGSGKANVKSPAVLYVNNDAMTAEIEWSSSNYDYMELDGKAYEPVNSEGNSVFLLDIPELDKEIPVKAETTAMSQPHLIDYTLYLDSQSIQKISSTNTGIISVSVVIALLALTVGIKIRRNYENKK